MANIQHGRFFKTIVTIFVFIALTFMARTIYLKHQTLKELSKESSFLDDQIEDVSDKIVNLKRNIQIAKNDPYAMEQKAKDRFMMVKKNETLMIFKDR